MPFKNILLIYLKKRERARESMGREERKSRLLVIREPNMGLNPRTLRS